MKNLLKTKIALLLFSALLLAGNSAYAQKSKSTVFSKANLAMQNAKTMQADILAPNEFAKAFKYYQDADKDFNNEKGIEKVEKNLREAVVFFNRASDFSYSAKKVFANTLNAREDALSAGADFYAKELWQKAEEQFVDASKELEKGDRDDSYKKSVKAIEIYRQAELSAIKTDLLDETRKIIEKADEMKVDKKAPKTLAKAKSLLAETEKELETNRYDMDYPRILAKRAKYEAKHAIFLYTTIKKMEDDNLKFEDVILNLENPIINIAEVIGFVAQFEEGFDRPENKIKEYITNLQLNQSRLAMQNSHQQYLIGQLDANIEVLKKEQNVLNNEFKTEIGKRSAENKAKMTAIEAEKNALAKKIEQQTNISDMFDMVNNIFYSSEAVVLRSGDDVIIRVHGFAFEVGKSEIKPANFELLTKVQTAIKVFPKRHVVVEGYTDSFGSDEANMALSQKRSDAVTEYLMANMSELKSTNITSVGFGENNPIANNETAEGRRQNRRIDIIIKPTL
jgi:outer membrane protein OmpA-like peptidoglycan-associated protein/HEPN domain-containing protein